MQRREFITVIGGAVAWPIAANAQQPKLPVVGFLDNGFSQDNATIVMSFRQGLDETGYVEGRNVFIEYRWAEADNDRLPALAADLVRRNVAVIATPNSQLAALAVKATNSNIPTVFGIGLDPVELGLVASYNRPGGNATGIVRLSHQLAAKRLELLHELVPSAGSVGVLSNPANRAAETEVNELRAAARALGLKLQTASAKTASEIEPAFAALFEKDSRALMISSDSLFLNEREKLTALASRLAIPASYPYREFVTVGGLMSYGSSNADSYRQVGVYVGRILKGERPAELPVQQAAKFELLINLKTAKALGLDAPWFLQQRADEVIE